MGIFDRIKRIVRANITDATSPDEVMYDSDGDLRRVIEELRQQAAYTARQKRAAQPPPRPNVDIALQRAYSTLGCAPSSSNDALKSAYRKLMRDHHPDTFAKASAAEQERAKSRSQDINNAYQLIKKHRGIT